jgi:hypothetical protein
MATQSLLLANKYIFATYSSLFVTESCVKLQLQNCNPHSAVRMSRLVLIFADLLYEVLTRILAELFHRFCE